IHQGYSALAQSHSFAGKNRGVTTVRTTAPASTITRTTNRAFTEARLLEEQPMTTTFDSALVTELAGQVSGSVLGPQDVGYDAARAVHNGLVDRKPALIVRCRTTCDVVAALDFAHREGLEVSIRGGGHNVAGRAVTDGGVMIDLAEMKRIEIDPDRATATAEGGV